MHQPAEYIMRKPSISAVKIKRIISEQCPSRQFPKFVCSASTHAHWKLRHGSRKEGRTWRTMRELTALYLVLKLSLLLMASHNSTAGCVWWHNECMLWSLGGMGILKENGSWGRKSRALEMQIIQFCRLLCRS